MKVQRENGSVCFTVSKELAERLAFLLDDSSDREVSELAALLKVAVRDETDVVTVAFDGGCRPNPGAGGWAWVAADGTLNSGGHPNTTNNAMELCALHDLLSHFPDRDLRIEYDSQYAANCATKWGPDWVRKGTVGDRPNGQLVFQIVRLLEARKAAGRVTRWTWVKGHSGHSLNEQADRLCSLEIAAQ